MHTRAHFYRRFALLKVNLAVNEGGRIKIFLDPETRVLARQVKGERTPILGGETGFRGYHAGPESHLVDNFVLTDAFPPRLSAVSDNRKSGRYLLTQ